MSLRKSPTMTPARIEANRRNALKSTGPRTARGKAQVRFNALKNGRHSRYYQDLRMVLFFAPPGAVLGSHQFLTPEMARHQLFAETLETAIWAEIQTCLANREFNSGTAHFRGN
jgi:hypothetical protein